MNTINNNLMAVNVANNLNAHYGRLSTSVERLSSGLRINSAADDAAGLAIRELMRADVAALNQGVRNANDAISMLQVADGALAIIDEKLIRMKELAEQAATGTYTSDQRLMIDSEFQAMGAEIDRIANATDFNGIHLLDGSLSGAHDGSALNATGQMKVHFGTANDAAEDYYYVEIGDCTTAGLGLREMLPFPKATGALSWLNDAKIDYPGRRIILDIPDAIAGRGDAAFVKGIDYYSLPVGLENITVTSNAVNSHPYHKPHVSIFDIYGDQKTGPPMTGTWTPSINASGNPGSSVSTSNWWNNMRPDDLINKGIAAGVFDPGAMYSGSPIYHQNSGISWGTVGNPADQVKIEMVTGQNEVGSKYNSTANKNGTAQPEILTISRIDADMVFFIGGHDNPSGGCNRYSLRIEADITDDFIKKLQTLQGDDGYELGEMIDIKTQEKAQKALVRIDEAIVNKDSIRANLGALQNRLENTVTNLTIQGENLQNAESRISDTDVAQEMTNFVRNQVLTQSAVAMLGQANNYPHILSQLING